MRPRRPVAYSTLIRSDAASRGLTSWLICRGDDYRGTRQPPTFAAVTARLPQIFVAALRYTRTDSGTNTTTIPTVHAIAYQPLLPTGVPSNHPRVASTM